MKLGKEAQQQRQDEDIPVEVEQQVVPSNAHADQGTKIKIS